MSTIYEVIELAIDAAEETVYDFLWQELDDGGINDSDLEQIAISGPDIVGRVAEQVIEFRKWNGEFDKEG